MQGTCISLDIGIEGVLLVMELFSLCVHAYVCVHAWGVCMGVYVCTHVCACIYICVCKLSLLLYIYR